MVFLKIGRRVRVRDRGLRRIGRRFGSLGKQTGTTGHTVHRDGTSGTRGGDGFTTALDRLHQRQNVDRGGTTNSLNVDRTLLSRCRGNVQRYKLSFIIGYTSCCNMAASCLLKISTDHGKLSPSICTDLNTRSSSVPLDALDRTAHVLLSATTTTSHKNTTQCVCSCCVLDLCQNTLAVTGTNVLPGRVFGLSCGLNHRLTSTTLTIRSTHFMFVRSGDHANSSIPRGATLRAVVTRTRRCVLGGFIVR